MRLHLFLAALLALPALPVGAEIFRWIDADGRVQYGDRPPPDSEVERIAVDAGAAVSGDLPQRDARRQRLLEVMEQDRQADGQAELEAERQAARRRDNCRIADERLQQAENAGYIYEPTADPYNPRVLDDAERAAYLSRLRQDVADWCD